MIPEKCKVVELLSPAADAAGRTGAWVSLKNVNKATIVVHITQGAANTVQLDVQQASAVAGTGAKALAGNTAIWSNLDCAASDTLVRRTDAAGTYTTDAGVKHKVIIFQVSPAQLDLANSFDCITVVTGASAAANITQAVAILDMAYASSLAVSTVTD